MARDSDFRPPERFDDYRLIRSLGQGGMGQVWLAHDTVLDRPVAVKFLTTGAPDPDARARLLVEARAVARVRHPNVLAVHRVGEIGAHPYIVVEYVPGRTLAEVPLPMASARVVEIGLGLARGLAAAHRAGVLHRDIKLTNAVLAADGSVKLLDFGVAKLVEAKTPMPAPGPSPETADRLDAPATVRPGSAESTVPRPDTPRAVVAAGEDATIADPLARTATPAPSGSLSHAGAEGWSEGARTDLSRGNTLIGTPAYMALELWDGLAATTRSDVYAFGCLLHALATGRLPLDGLGSIPLLVERLRSGPIPPIGDAVEPGLAAVIGRCLERDPSARFEGGEELCAALEALVPASVPARDAASLAEPALLERMRRELLVVVAGDGTVARSRMEAAARAVESGTLGDGRRWTTHPLELAPGPMEVLERALEAALAGTTTVDLVLAPEAAAVAVTAALGGERGLLLVVGDVEPLSREASFAEAVAFARAAGLLLGRAAGGVRLLAAAEDRALVRLSSLPGWSPWFARARHA